MLGMEGGAWEAFLLFAGCERVNERAWIVEGSEMFSFSLLEEKL